MEASGVVEWLRSLWLVWLVVLFAVAGMRFMTLAVEEQKAV